MRYDSLDESKCLLYTRVIANVLLRVKQRKSRETVAQLPCTRTEPQEDARLKGLLQPRFEERFLSPRDEEAGCEERSSRRSHVNSLPFERRDATHAVRALRVMFIGHMSYQTFF